MTALDSWAVASRNAIEPRELPVGQLAPERPHFAVRRPLLVILLVDTVALTSALALCLAALHEPMVLTLFVVVSVIVAMAWSGYAATDLSAGGIRPTVALRAAARVIATVAVISLVLPWIDVSQTVAVALVAGGLMTAGRLLIQAWVARQRSAGRLRLPVIVRGTAEEIATFNQWLQTDPSQPLHVVGVQAIDGVSVANRHGVALLANCDVAEAAQALSASGVVTLASTTQDPEKFRHLVWDLKQQGLRVFAVPAITSVTPPTVYTIGTTGVSALSFEADVDNPFKRAMKTTFDIVGAALLVLVLSPVLLGVSLTIRLTSPGPVFFLQERVGRDGRTFKMIKFRSMYRDAEKRRAEVAEQNMFDTGTLFKIPDDPRVTPVGRHLRRYSVDELPQLFNVLRAEMSLVGPRPPLPEEVANYCREARRRFKVKPGLTGLWQVSGRSDLDPDESRRLDTHYVEHTSAAMELRILAKTVNAVTRGSGAY